MTDDKEYSGHITHTDGTHTRLTSDEAKALWDAAIAAEAERAETMPETIDALDAVCSAKQRLRELGWREGQYCPKHGEEFAVIEWGCTGIFPAIYHGEWPKGSLLYSDCFQHPHGCMFKPLDALTDAERATMNECIERDRIMSDREARAFGAIF